jgi:hypothetical protein
VCWEFLSELLALASAILLWLPAWRLSQEQFTADALDPIANKKKWLDLARLARIARETLSGKHGKWDKQNHRLLMWGFACFAASAVLKMLCILAKSHG